MAKPRAYVGSFTVRLGAITVRGRLVPIRKPEPKKPVLITPDGQPVRQCYIDTDLKTYYKEDLGRAYKDDDGNLIPIDPNLVEEAKRSDLVPNTLSLTAHNQSEIERFLFPSNNNAYIFEPVIKHNNKVIEDPDNEQWYNALNVMVRDSGAVFIGKCNLNNHEGLYRLSMYQGHVVVQKQLYPEDLHQFEEIHPEIDTTTKGKLLKLVAAMTEPFDPEQYENAVARRLAEIPEGEYDPSSLVERAPVAPTMDLGSALDSLLDEIL